MARPVPTAIHGDSGTRRPVSVLLLAAATISTAALALVGGARADDPPPGLTLGPVTVSGNTVVVSGTVGGDPTAQADVEVNGQNVGADGSGNFTAVVDLDGQSYVELTATAGDQTTTIDVPVALMKNGGQGVLDDLQAAGVSVEIPPDGFQIVDGQMPTVTGSVLNRDELASLTVNGQDVMTFLGPDGSFSVVPAPGQQVVVVSTDHNGVSQKTTYRTTTLTSTIRTKSGTSVSALGAQGLVVAKVRFDKRRLLTQRRLGVLVTVKDRRGYLVRGAAVRLKGLPLRYFASGSRRAGFTNAFGVDRFVYSLRKRALTDAKPRWLSVLVRASTPRAAAAKLAKVRLPRLAAT